MFWVKKFYYFITNNYLRGLKQFNIAMPLLHVLFLLIFGVLASFTGFYAGIFHWAFEKSIFSPFYLLILFVFPSFLEESFFRGFLIPIETAKKGRSSVIKYTILSSLAFVLWHPVNAFLLNPGARTLFYNPFFLTVVFLLGIFCSLSYIFSRSLWPAVIIHWIVVVAWVGFLGGRNLVLQNLSF
ncbi:CPBP family glutamic-type intramembrane protease [Flexistipes sp.]|uniref:CPBP family glutamic-type intramembrane protease n=1 Tax=Flexistipes sp. TaxID=3088135 RepID=UPI002E20AEFF|nr:CPBP family glutamic-type intramembrane protease [Flexistipes sp.]